jgi:hypothetical protein
VSAQPSQCDRVMAVLADDAPHTIEEIHERAGTMRLNSRVAELRDRLRPQGRTIACWRHEGTYAYQLVALGEADSERGGCQTSARDESASPSALPDRSSGAGVGVAAAPAPSPPSHVTETRESLNEMLREELALAYESLEKLMWAVPVSDAAGARRDERVVVVRRQISELESALIFEGAAA